MKKAVIFTVLLVSVFVLGYSQTAYTVRNVAGWIEAVNGIRNGGNDQEYNITVTGNISIPASADSTFGSVTGVTVTIEGSGTLSTSNIGILLVVGKEQTIIVKDLTLKGRDANSVSMIKIENGGKFRMEGKASVGWVEVGEQGSFTMCDSASVSGVSIAGGTFTMQDKASVTGGRVTVKNGTFTMQDSASVSRGGVEVGEDGTFTMQDSVSVSGGSGVHIDKRGTFTMKGGTISNNTSTAGGGVYNEGTFTMQGGTISSNTSTSSASYIPAFYNPRYSNAYSGGGVYNKGIFTMQGGTISGNTSTASSSAPSGDTSGYVAAAGGVFNEWTFTMQGGTISGNTSTASSSAPNSSASGGVYSRGTFTMQGGTVSGNTSTASSLYSGGGVYVVGTFIMQGNALVSGNKTSGCGGGVYVGGTFTMQDSVSVSGNTATSSGGGVYVGGTFTMKDSALVSGNTATYYGGGVVVDYDGTFSKTGGTIYGDDADQNLKNTVISGLGHSMYNAINSGWRNATAGPTMNHDSYGFWLNDGDVVMFPSDEYFSPFAGIWKRTNFNNTLEITANIMKSSSSNYLWVLQRISGNAYTLKRGDAANTMTLTIRREGNNLVISGDSGSGENNWNGTWQRPRR